MSDNLPEQPKRKGLGLARTVRVVSFRKSEDAEYEIVGKLELTEGATNTDDGSQIQMSEDT